MTEIEPDFQTFGVGHYRGIGELSRRTLYQKMKAIGYEIMHGSERTFYRNQRLTEGPYAGVEITVEYLQVDGVCFGGGIDA